MFLLMDSPLGSPLLKVLGRRYRSVSSVMQFNLVDIPLFFPLFTASGLLDLDLDNRSLGR